MRILHERGYNDIHLYLIGPETSAEYVRVLQEFIQKHNLNPQVKWLGYIQPQEIKHYLANVDVGLAPGIYTHQYKNPGLTTKLFEYLLMGLPVLSVDYPHRKMYIEESRCGLAVKAQDVQAHVEAILWFYHHPEESRMMGKRGRAMVEDHYIWEKEAGRLLEFYERIVS